MKLNLEIADRTLERVDLALAATFAATSKPRYYLGASIAGHECNRRLWYEHRGLRSDMPDAETIRKFEDGHTGELIMARRLRKVREIDLWTDIGYLDGTGEMRQWEVSWYGGHVSGHLDGVIRGIVEAPKTPHVWEHKASAEKYVNELDKIRREVGEKNALERWNWIYFVQAQLYMLGMKLTRHFLTVSTPGERRSISVRTNFDKDAAAAALARAGDVVKLNRPPSRISEDRTYFRCRYCPCTSYCHGTKIPTVSCMSCMFSRPLLDRNSDDPRWECTYVDPIEIPKAVLPNGCAGHLYRPELINHSTHIETRREEHRVYYRRPDGQVWINGGISDLDAYPSKLLEHLDAGLIGDETIAQLRLKFGDMISVPRGEKNGSEREGGAGGTT